MYKKILVVVFIATLMFLFAGCDPTIELTFEDIEGQWEFPADDGDTEGPFISIMEGQLLDISWYDGSDYYFCWGDGSYDNGTFSLTYDYNIDYSDPLENDTSGSDATVTVRFTLTNNKLKAVCTGHGPLAGETFDLGTLVT
jgi:hypothetical protein